jgi:NAD(P)H-hydrate repair Nnr-like enzyme with NAD(P)H-hydrate dehydratase domain
MDTEVAGFSPSQQLALLDLLVLAVYADGHLATAEDEPVKKLLIGMGLGEGPDRQRAFEAAVTRMRPSLQPFWRAKTQAILLADAFTEREQQKQVFAAVEQIMAADNHVSSWEGMLLMELRMKFRL